VGPYRIERNDNARWLVTSLKPEQVWPQLQAFFKDRGLTLVVDQPEAGVMETEWAENRARLPQDIIRRTLGRVLDSLYSTSELDKYRVRVERVAEGSEIYLSHRGLQEVYSNTTKDTTVWQPRPRELELEAAMLSRLMVKLGTPADQARAAETAVVTASAATAPTRARALPGRAAASLQIDDSFDRAWRRVGLALDRSGFTVEDRDRAQGVYFVRYVDPAQAGKEEPGFFARLFGSDKGPTGPVRYRVSVKADGPATVVSVLNADGAPENGEAGQRIVTLLVEDLK
jgi:outer membrane protein assembly factor BamC